MITIAISLSAISSNPYGKTSCARVKLLQAMAYACGHAKLWEFSRRIAPMIIRKSPVAIPILGVIVA